MPMIAPITARTRTMGQIMKYHNWPTTGTGSHSYTHSTYGTLSANFGATTYQWSSMPSSGRVTSYNSAVATLLYHVGVSVDMGYGPSSSGASPSKVSPALRNYFKYNAGSLESRSSYSDSAWEAKLRADLDAGRPVLAVGTGLHGTRLPAEEHYRARQMVLDALGGTVGSFRVELLAQA